MTKSIWSFHENRFIYSRKIQNCFIYVLKIVEDFSCQNLNNFVDILYRCLVHPCVCKFVNKVIPVFLPSRAWVSTNFVLTQHRHFFQNQKVKPQDYLLHTVTDDHGECCHDVITMLSACYHVVITMLSACCHVFIMMLSACCHVVIMMLSACRHHVIMNVWTIPNWRETWGVWKADCFKLSEGTLSHDD